MPSLACRRRRYSGSSPASDSTTQRAVTSPDPAQAAQLAGRREGGQLVGVTAAEGGGGPAERPDAVGRLVGALEQERDPAQVGDGIAGSGHVAMVPRMGMRVPVSAGGGP